MHIIHRKTPENFSNSRYAHRGCEIPVDLSGHNVDKLQPEIFALRLCG
jgi:hypothetical protein